MKDNTRFHHELSGKEAEFFMSAAPSEAFISRLQGDLNARYQKLNKREGIKGSSVNTKGRISYFFTSLRPVVVPIVLLIILFSVIGAVYAFGIYKGYLPGFGPADPESSFRILPDPVSQTRDGIEVKVVSVISGADHTAVVYSISGVPASALPGEYSPMSTKQRICAPKAGLILPDQTELQTLWRGAMGYSEEGAYQKIALFETIPDTADSLTFTLSCIEGTLPNTTPENWEIAFHLDPSPRSLTVTEPQAFMTNSSDTSMANIQIDEVFQLEDEILLIGSVNEKTVSLENLLPDDISFSDKNGNKLPWKTPGDVVPQSENGRGAIFAFMVDASVSDFPISMEIGSVTGICAGIANLDLDISEIPVDGKEHPYAKKMDFTGCTLELTGITRTTYSLELHLSARNYLLDGVAIETSDANGEIMLMEKAPGELLVHVNYTTPIAANPQTFRFVYPSMRVIGPWTSVIDLEEGD